MSHDKKPWIAQLIYVQMQYMKVEADWGLESQSSLFPHLPPIRVPTPRLGTSSLSLPPPAACAFPNSSHQNPARYRRSPEPEQPEPERFASSCAAAASAAGPGATGSPPVGYRPRGLSFPTFPTWDLWT